jgi:hypothetical protein
LLCVPRSGRLNVYSEICGAPENGVVSFVPRCPRRTQYETRR